jgi:hypothetical protein
MVQTPRWTEEEFATEMSAELHRALEAARRGGDTVVWPVPSPVGEVRVQAVEAHPDGAWALIDHVDQEGR